MVAFYVLAAPLVRSLGFPSLMAIYLAILFVLYPSSSGTSSTGQENGSSLGSVCSTGSRCLACSSRAGSRPLCVVVDLLRARLPAPRCLLNRERLLLVARLFFLVEDFAGYSTGALVTTWVLGMS
jgi:hypothetical protein